MRFWGYGSAFNPAFGNTCAYFERERALFLIDCGELVFSQLFKREMLKKYENIYILITHTHADHIGSLGSVISYTYYVLGKQVTVIHPTPELWKILDLMGIDRAAYIRNETDRLSLLGLWIEAIPVKHASDIHCYGYLLSDDKKTIYYSGDSYEIPTSVLREFLNGHIDELYQDTTNQVSVHRSHFPLCELADVIPGELRNKVFCMHFTSDFSEEIKTLGFSNVMGLVEW